MKNILIIGLLIAAVGTAFVSVIPASAQVMSVTGVPLSASEQEDLIFMREEEKLAHDVYATLYAAWKLPVFQNIANSEATHTAVIKRLLDRYGIADPAAGKGVGEFANPDLQKLYDQLVVQGGQSLADALKVGATIEEIDILDLQTRIARTTSADIKLAYSNLMKGSENHLRAFTATLQRQTGKVYVPQYLTPEMYQSIISDGNGNGRRGNVDRSEQGWRGGNR